MRSNCGTALVGALLLTSGCYAYRPVELVPTPGTQVRIVLASSTDLVTIETDAEATRRIQAGVFEVCGALEAATESTVAVRLGTLWISTGKVGGVEGRIVLVPADRIALIEERRFQPGRTFFAGMGLSTLVLAVFLVVVLGEMFSAF